MRQLIDAIVGAGGVGSVAVAADGDAAWMPVIAAR
jgi:hypothetical protein